VYIVYTVWNSLPANVDFSILPLFKQSVAQLDLSQFQHSCVCPLHWRPITILGDFDYSIYFTARRYASGVYAIGLCLSVCLSVTSRNSSTETAKRRITQTTPSDSLGSLLMPKISAKFTANVGAKHRWGGLKSANFDKVTRDISKTIQDSFYQSWTAYHNYTLYRIWWHRLISHIADNLEWLAPNRPKPPHFLHFALPFISL